MRAGSLDERVTLQQPVTVRDSYGQETVTWQAVATVWAGVQALRGREYFAAAAVQRELTVKVRLRYRADVVSTWRLVHRGTAYNIEAVIPVGRREWLELMCNARPNDAGR